MFFQNVCKEMTRKLASVALVIRFEDPRRLSDLSVWSENHWGRIKSVYRTRRI